MIKKEAILRAYVEEKLSDLGMDFDEEVFNALVKAVTLEEGEPIESEEIRSVYLQEGSDGKPTAKSIKFYNLMKISYHDLLGFLLKESTIFFTEDSRLKAMFSIFNLLHEFYPKLSYTFNEQDAGILLSLYDSGKKEFLSEEVPALYQTRYGKSLSDVQLSRTLDTLVEIKVLRYLGEGKYTIREKMIYERN